MAGKPLALVTGRSTGIGYALAQQCVRHGFSVIITGASGCRPPGAAAGKKMLLLEPCPQGSTFSRYEGHIPSQISSTRNDPSHSIGESGSAHRRSVRVWMEWLRRGACVLRLAMLVPRGWRSGSKLLVVPHRAHPTLRWR